MFLIIFSVRVVIAGMTRRQLMLGVVGFLGIAQAQDATTIHEVVELHASPHKVYEALVDSKLFTAFSGAPGEIHREPGGMFAAARRKFTVGGCVSMTTFRLAVAPSTLGG